MSYYLKPWQRLRPVLSFVNITIDDCSEWTVAELSKKEKRMVHINISLSFIFYIFMQFDSQWEY